MVHLFIEDWIMYASLCLVYCFQSWIPLFKKEHVVATHIDDLTVSVGQDYRHGPTGVICHRISQEIAIKVSTQHLWQEAVSVSGGCSLISRLSWKRIHSKLTHVVVGRIQFFVGCWTEGLRSLPGGSLYIRGQGQSERECKQNRSHTLSYPHYESDITSAIVYSL